MVTIWLRLIDYILRIREMCCFSRIRWKEPEFVIGSDIDIGFHGFTE